MTARCIDRPVVVRLQLERVSAALAAATAAWVCSPGSDRVADAHRIDLLVHFLACFKAVLVATPLNYRYTFRQVDHAFEVSGARAFLGHVDASRI